MSCSRFSACSKGGAGGQLVRFSSEEEFDLMADFLMASTESLPQRSGWLTGGFTDTFNIYSSLSDIEKRSGTRGTKTSNQGSCIEQT